VGRLHSLNACPSKSVDARRNGSELRVSSLFRDFFPRHYPMKKDRYFYSIVSFTMLVLTVIGFSKFLSRGIESDDAPIPPAIKALVIVHGVALISGSSRFSCSRS
jgi:hypothetical protein